LLRTVGLLSDLANLKTVIKTNTDIHNRHFDYMVLRQAQMKHWLFMWSLLFF